MYKIVGADQKEYGPVDIDQVRKWIAEGRANGQTIARFQDGPWKPLSSFPEFANDLAAAPVPATPPPSLPAAGAPGPFIAQPQIPNYLVQAILVTVCCCLPFGIPAIVYAAQVNSKLAGGDIAGAQYSSDRAKMWCWISFLLGLVGSGLYFVLILTTGGLNIPEFQR